MPGGQPSQGSIPGPKRGSVHVQVVFPPNPFKDPAMNQLPEYHTQRSSVRNAMIVGEITGEFAYEATPGTFPGAKPFINMWLMGDLASSLAPHATMAGPYTSEATDEWGYLELWYPIAPSTKAGCEDVLDISACHFDGTNYYKSDTVRLYCPQNSPTETKITLTLQPSSTPIDCQPKGIGAIEIKENS